jgi:heptaprenylglyceryl phosphate synthase
MYNTNAPYTKIGNNTSIQETTVNPLLQMRFRIQVQNSANRKWMKEARIVSVEIIKEMTIDNIANPKYIFEGRQREEILNFIL